MTDFERVSSIINHLKLVTNKVERDELIGALKSHTNIVKSGPDKQPILDVKKISQN